MEHTAKGGGHKLLEHCTLPLTGKRWCFVFFLCPMLIISNDVHLLLIKNILTYRCVDMVITELGVFELLDGGMVLTEIGVFFEFKASLVGNSLNSSLRSWYFFGRCKGSNRNGLQGVWWPEKDGPAVINLNIWWTIANKLRATSNKIFWQICPAQVRGNKFCKICKTWICECCKLSLIYDNCELWEYSCGSRRKPKSDASQDELKMFQDLSNEPYMHSLQNDMLCLAGKMDIFKKRHVKGGKESGFPS